MADDKIQLVPQDGTTHVPNEDPPNYTPVAQQQTVVMNQYGQPVVHQQTMGYNQPAGQYAQPTGQYAQPAGQYAQPAGQYSQQMQYAPPAGQQMTYAQAGPGQQTVVVSQPQAQTIVVQGGAPRPPTWMWLSCVVFWCCNPIAGGIAFILSVMSASAADDNDNKHASRLGKASLWTSVAGVIISVVAIIVLVVVLVEAAKKVEDDFGTSLQQSLNNMNDVNNDINSNLNNDINNNFNNNFNKDNNNPWN